MKIVNLTPHALTLKGVDGVLVVPPSGEVVRVSQTDTALGVVQVDGVELPLVAKQFGAVVGLPDAQDGVLFVVSGMVRSALTGRDDVWAPGPLLRDDAGNVVGANGLSR